jgi:beta-lactamase superfamily II metal-dependent hydrolase
MAAQESQPRAPAQSDVPTNASGEEVFGQGYMPYAPAADAVPLEAGRPSAGFNLSAIADTQTIGSLQGRFGDPQARPDDKSRLRNVPLLRRFQRSNALPRFRGGASRDNAADEAAATGTLKVHFVQVGQGAGAILEFPCAIAVIDTGGEYATGLNTVKGGELFEAYLDRFFRERPERNRTIDVLFTSHPHEDHLAGLRVISSRTGPRAYVVRDLVDNGQTYDRGSLKEQRDFANWARTQNARYAAITVDAMRSATGVTNSVIDPMGSCQGVDPVITGFWGSNYAKIKPNATDTDPWTNPNNHSLVLRVDFGKASFLFVGDLEDTASNEMLREYASNPGVLDVDVYAVSHHGAGDDTTDPLLKAMSPRIAVISMGTTAARGRATAAGYGHPRLEAIDVMQKQPEVVSDTRGTQSFAVASKQNVFANEPITRAIYGTGWEGSLIVEATAQGQYRITRAP